MRVVKESSLSMLYHIFFLCVSPCSAISRSRAVDAELTVPEETACRPRHLENNSISSLGIQHLTCVHNLCRHVVT